MKWWLYVCSDCDLDDGAVIVQVPDDTNPLSERGSPIDYCPGCTSGAALAYRLTETNHKKPCPLSSEIAYSPSSGVSTFNPCTTR